MVVRMGGNEVRSRALAALLLAVLVVSACGGAPAAQASPTATGGATAASTASAAFDEKAVAAFYQGKTVRLVLGLPAGTSADIGHRIIAKYVTKYLPGTPTIIVENKPGASGLVAANQVFNTEPQDGTVISGFVEGNVLQQALGATGINFDAGKLQFLGSAVATTGACLARRDAGIESAKDTLGTGGKQIIVGLAPPGGTTHDIAAVMKAALGANWKTVPGYESGQALNLALQRNEIQAYCITLGALLSDTLPLVDGPSSVAKIIVVNGATVPDHTVLKGVPSAESLAPSEDAKLMLRAQNASMRMNTPTAVGPNVPADRVAALRQAYAKALADPALIEEAKKAKLEISPKSAAEVTVIVKDVLATPPAILAKLKTALQP
jgi:tripartite-type tricarboxylate transporter receptor subunit TctC